MSSSYNIPLYSLLPGESHNQQALTFAGQFCIEASVDARRTDIANRRYFAATIEHKDPGFLPKSILISDDLFKHILHPGITYEIYGHIINHLHRYPPMMFVDYQTSAPEPTDRMPKSTCSKAVTVSGTGHVMHRFDREAFHDVMVIVKHRDYDHGALEWVEFYAEYICGKKYNDNFDPTPLQVGANIQFKGHIKGFYESRNTWIIRCSPLSGFFLRKHPAALSCIEQR
ncbi:uncharacterized protein MELLADRAFT_114392 [Melampsora larici-populina 98AG31]|uniref:Uncharacterized protein n=1 Tax=Melampsora larici-populina (strain 98AG31 / pathotype 3-4-7) TaxID=747676 RepID=F4SDA2_MELLP|nr:uncharacterized protein MELLADRAFT_114392 [Melampsora larici-populina 98AG31]EGF97374.1 hypothetical protein MELLADRAFT_114392 [Melampsora larici-populina 98AG31]